MPIITFVVAACSVLYELLLSSVSTIFLGGTFFRYITTIGIYIFCLGMGSLYFEKMKTKGSRLEQLLQVELYLSLFGFLIPLIPICIELMLKNSQLTWFPKVEFLTTVIHFQIIFIGILSGIELPLLMKISEEEKKGGGLKALAIDLMGTFAGVLLFSLFFLPTLGIFQTSFIISFLNLMVSGYLFSKLKLKPRKTFFILVAVSLLGGLISLLYGPLLAERIFS